jgi:hypothetical protein
MQNAEGMQNAKKHCCIPALLHSCIAALLHWCILALGIGACAFCLVHSTRRFSAAC